MKQFRIMSCLSLVVLIAVGLVVGCNKSTDTPTSPTAITESKLPGDLSEPSDSAKWVTIWEWTKPLGGVDLWGYCNSQGYQQAVLVPPKDAYSWRCYKKVNGQETWAGISVNAACQRQYPAPNYKDVSAYVNGSSKNPSAWKCQGNKKKTVWR